MDEHKNGENDENHCENEVLHRQTVRRPQKKMNREAYLVQCKRSRQSDDFKFTCAPD